MVNNALYSNYNKNTRVETKNNKTITNNNNTYNVSVSFHSGFREALIVLVFFLTLSLSGMRRAFTYGSERPFGSIGIKFFPWRTEYQRERECIKKELVFPWQSTLLWNNMLLRLTKNLIQLRSYVKRPGRL